MEPRRPHVPPAHPAALADGYALLPGLLPTSDVQHALAETEHLTATASEYQHSTPRFELEPSPAQRPSC